MQGVAASKGAGAVQPRWAGHERVDTIAFAAFVLDLRGELLYQGGRVSRMPPKAFALLRYLVERAGRLVTKEELLRELWGDVHVSSAVLKTHMSRVRRALGDDVRRPRYVQTVYRRGYRFMHRDVRPRGEAHGRSPAPEHRAHAGDPESERDLLSRALAGGRGGRRRLVLLESDADLLPDVVRDALQTQAERQRRPLMIISDIDAADATTREFVEQWAAAPALDGALLIVTQRGEARRGAWRAPRARCAGDRGADVFDLRRGPRSARD